MHRELRYVVTGVEPTLFVPHLLTMTSQIEQFKGADCNLVEPIKQADRGELANCVRQRVYADAEFANGIGLFVELAIDAAGPQHQGGRKSAYPAADDDRLHGLTLP